MARLILHIGTHKTATTSFQDICHKFSSTLAKNGVIYPCLPNQTGHHGAFDHWINLPKCYDINGGGLRYLLQLADKWRSSENTLILSSEEMSRASGPGGRINWAELLTIFHGFEVEIWLILRNQWQFIQSVYIQLARTRIPPPPGQLIAQALDTGCIDGLWVDYQKLFQMINRESQGANFRLFDFEALAATSEGIVRYLLREAQVEIEENLAQACKKQVSNQSVEPLAAWASTIIASGHHISTDLLTAFEQALKLEFQSPHDSVYPLTCLYTRQESQEVFAHFHTQNSRFINQYLDHGLTMSTPREGMVYRDDLDQKFWIRGARRLWLNHR